jgi:hypothetical protein
MAATASPSTTAGLSRVQVTGLISLMLVSGVSNSMLNKCVFFVPFDAVWMLRW